MVIVSDMSQKKLLRAVATNLNFPMCILHMFVFRGIAFVQFWFYYFGVIQTASHLQNEPFEPNIKSLLGLHFIPARCSLESREWLELFE